MRLTWNELTISLLGVECDALLADWRWLIDASFTLVIITALGDLFLRAEDGSISWLETVAGRLTKVAADAEEFKRLMVEPENVAEWFLPQLVGDLKAGGMNLEPGQCYSFILPPVLNGTIEPSNIETTDLRIHFSMLGQIHRQAKDLPEATPIRRFTTKEPS